MIWPLGCRFSGTQHASKQFHARCIPFELLDYIIHFLDGNKASMASFSLVCRAWYRPTRPHLFGSFALNCALLNSPLAGRKLCNGLLRVLDGSPHLAHYFRHIELFIYASSQLAQDPSLHSVLRRFPSVQTLIFRTFTDEWSRLPLDLVSSLHRIISNPSFERLEIHRVRFAPRAPELAVFLNHCARSLRYLTLVGVSYDAEIKAQDHSPPDPIPQLTNLREMEVFGNSTNQTLLAMNCDMPNLRRYHQNTNISSAWWQPVFTIVQPCIPPSVSDLSLTIRLPVFFSSLLGVH
ncbi:hypothetical protein BDN71DRAFT_1022805 [Pleurotus eryngii]|uniref:F-box domain-containing protein n=1 Tax=Pleurotus eryngii TaxID=5323 RepID=A0A9P6DED2_PLEER|nr:hypothetical protein BDN71DRAFT_1022805 [Pleurotus eryngii]